MLARLVDVKEGKREEGRGGGGRGVLKIRILGSKRFVLLCIIRFSDPVGAQTRLSCKFLGKGGKNSLSGSWGTDASGDGKVIHDKYSPSS